MLLKRAAITLLSSLLVFSSSSVSGDELTFRTINLVENDFNSTDEWKDYLKTNNITAPELLAECSAYIAVMNPIMRGRCV